MYTTSMQRCPAPYAREEKKNVVARSHFRRAIIMYTLERSAIDVRGTHAHSHISAQQHQQQHSI